MESIFESERLYGLVCAVVHRNIVAAPYQQLMKTAFAATVWCASQAALMPNIVIYGVMWRGGGGK